MINNLIEKTKYLVVWVLNEVPGFIQKNYVTAKIVLQPWISRCIAYLWLVILFYSCYPVFLMSVIAWYMSKSRKSTHNMLPENERKTILMTGSTSTRGTLYYTI